MKCFLLLVPLAVSAILPSIAAEEPSAKKEQTIRIELQVFVGKKAELQPLARELMAPATRAKAFARLEELSRAGTVELANEVIGQTSENEEFTAFKGEVVRYPTQFEQPEMLTPRTDPQTAKPVGALGPSAFGFSASSYESRNVGTSLTLYVTVGEGGQESIVSAEWKRSWLVQWDEFEVGRLPNNEKMIIKQPRFAEAGSNGKFGVAAGERTLLGIHAVPGTPDQVELVVFSLEVNAAKPR